MEQIEKTQISAQKKKTFSKENLMRAKVFAFTKDALRVCLKDGERYTIGQAKKLLDEFMKGKV